MSTSRPTPAGDPDLAPLRLPPARRDRPGPPRAAPPPDRRTPGRVGPRLHHRRRLPVRWRRDRSRPQSRCGRGTPRLDHRADRDRAAGEVQQHHLGPPGQGHAGDGQHHRGDGLPERDPGSIALVFASSAWAIGPGSILAFASAAIAFASAGVIFIPMARGRALTAPTPARRRHLLPGLPRARRLPAHAGQPLGSSGGRRQGRWYTRPTLDGGRKSPSVGVSRAGAASC